MRHKPVACETLALILSFMLLTGCVSGVHRPWNSQGGSEARPSQAEIMACMKRVADWQLAHPANPARHQLYEWGQGALYTGIMALARASGDAKYEQAALDMGRANGWKVGPQIYNGNQHCIPQTYLELYFKYRDPKMIESTRTAFNQVIAQPKDTNLDLRRKGWIERWSWCDALFMAPPAWARMSQATGDRKYLDYMNKYWWITSDYLYDPIEHLFFRDNRYFTQHEANGRKIFWGRGNGWVIAGLARVLESMPADYPDRPKFVRQFQEMSARLLELQGPDGLWGASLLDRASYPAPETSGSAFNTFALAWGLNAGLLPGPGMGEHAVYEQAVRKAWKGLTGCVQPDGMLGYVQAVGDSPRRVKATDTEVYGVGAFLLAGSEMMKLDGAGTLTRNNTR